MKKDLRIGYITTEDPHDRRSWSGIMYHLFEALKDEFKVVEPLGPLRPQPELFIGQASNQLLLRLLGKRFNYRDSFMLSKAYARSLGRRMEKKRLDVLVTAAGLPTIALLNTNLPIVYFNDRCLAGALDYHTILSDLTPASRKEGLAVEERALANASLVVYASHWAADAAREHYPQHAHKVHVIPMGANLAVDPPEPAERQAPSDPLKMLFLGVKWKEKGGPIAYEALQVLKSKGRRTKLVVCGCDPPPECDDPDLVREGFLNKNLPEHRARLEEHLRTADLLILPTRFEAYGIVFCEAAAYGVPAFATRTGGVPTIVQDGITGFLFDPQDDGTAYAEKIEALVSDPSRWRAMRKAARERYKDTLTWKAFVRTLADQIEALAPRSSSR